MRHPLRTRTTVVALLLAATAAGTGTGTAHAAGSTGTAFQIEDLTAVLSVQAEVDDATATTSVSYVGDKPVVLAQLGTITVTDKRVLSSTLGWSYSASVPGSIEPVVGVENRQRRNGVTKPTKSGAQFRVPAAPVGNGTATFSRKATFETVNGGGTVSNLVTRSTLGTSSTTTFAPELRIELPAGTEAGAYEVVVTHSVS